MSVTALSHTMLDDVLRCEKKYEYRYIRGYAKRVKAARVEKGDWVHVLLAAYWRALKEGNDPQAAIEAEHQRVRSEWWDVLFEEQQELLGADLPDVCLGIARRYAQHYHSFDVQNWRKILSVEAKVQVRFDWLPLPFTFKADVIALDRQGWVWVIEHKVVGEIPNEDNRAADTQGPRYMLALQQMLASKGIRVKGVGVIYDYLRDRVPAVPQVNKDGSISKRWIDTDYETFRAAVEAQGLDVADYQDILDRIQREGRPYFERWPVPRSQARLEETARDMRAIAERRLVANGTAPIRTLDRTRCPWDCEFFPLCMVEVEGGDISPMLRELYEVRGGDDGAGTQPGHGAE